MEFAYEEHDGVFYIGFVIVNIDDCFSRQPWIVSSQTKSSSNQPLEESVLHSLRQFALASHMKRAALTMMAYCLTTKDIEGNCWIEFFETGPTTSQDEKRLFY